MLIVLTRRCLVFLISRWTSSRTGSETHLSTEMSELSEELFSASSDSSIKIVLISLALWASSSLAFSLSRLTTYTLSYGRYRFNFFIERAKAIPMAMISILVVAVALILYVYGELIALRIIRSPFLVELISDLRTPVLASVFHRDPGELLSAAADQSTGEGGPSGTVVATYWNIARTWIYSLYTSRAGTTTSCTEHFRISSL